MNDVIKNPKRNSDKKEEIPIPEHKRLKIDVKEKPGTETFVIDNVNIDDVGNETTYENGHYIDNNEYVNFMSSPVETPKKIGDFILMVFGKVVLTGDLHEVENKIRAIMYKEDKEFADKEVNIDEIVVLKKLNIKIGIFVDV